MNNCITVKFNLINLTLLKVSMSTSNNAAEAILKYLSFLYNRFSWNDNNLVSIKKRDIHLRYALWWNHPVEFNYYLILSEFVTV